MKIALLTPTFSPFSGIDRVVELDAEEYINEGKDITIFTLRSDIKPKRAKLEVMGLPKNPLLERVYRLFFFLDIFKIKKYAKKLKQFDEVIAYFYPLTIIANKAKKKYGIKYTYWNAGIAFPHLFKKLSERIYLKLFLFFVKRSVKNADSAISISKFMAKELKKETGLNSIVKYIEIDKKRFHKGIRGEMIRNKYKIDSKDSLCLYVGRISPHKGIHLLIDAFNLAKIKKPNLKLLIVGKPTFHDYFKRLKKISNNSIIFTGFVSDQELPKYYAACDVYTTATLWEGYNLPVVEAQACGKPIVAFNLASHPEVVKNGILVKPKNTKEFAQAILKLVQKQS